MTAGTRTIGVVTVGRSDYSYYLPILRRIREDDFFCLHLIVSGTHLSPQFGLSVDAIRTDGFEIAEQVEMLVAADTPSAIAKSIGLGVIGFAQAYARLRSEILLLLGDRFEMLAAAIALLPYAIPIAHIAGGEATEGVIDEAIRHSLTKMSHLHFVSTAYYRQRVIQMGEEPWRVTVSGAPSLDILRDTRFISLEEVERALQVSLRPPPLLVTFHPVTLEYQETAKYVKELMKALEKVALPVIFTYPNADTCGQTVVQAVEAFVKRHRHSVFFINLGSELYFSLMKHALAMVGNSSSGIIEAASLKLPVVNIGDRQRGRIHGRNVVDVACEADAIVDGIRKATSDEFMLGFQDLSNPYGDGHAAERIVEVLRSVPLDRRLLMKRFHEVSQGLA